MSKCLGTNQSGRAIENIEEMQVIDYKENEPLHDYLSQRHYQDRFDAIVDTVGVQQLYTHCPAYLSEDGRFVNIGAMQVKPTIGSLLSFFWAQFCNTYWPSYLGGTPRWFRMMSGTPNLHTLSRVKTLAEERVLKSVIDSIWDIKDALKVCLTSSPQSNELISRKIIRIYVRLTVSSCYLLGI